MQTIEFTTEELGVLHELLQHKIEAIDVEMFRTDTHDFKQVLKHRRHVLEQMLEKTVERPIRV